MDMLGASPMAALTSRGYATPDPLLSVSLLPPPPGPLPHQLPHHRRRPPPIAAQEARRAKKIGQLAVQDVDNYEDEGLTGGIRAVKPFYRRRVSGSQSALPLAPLLDGGLPPQHAGQDLAALPDTNYFDMANTAATQPTSYFHNHQQQQQAQQQALPATPRRESISENLPMLLSSMSMGAPRTGSPPKAVDPAFARACLSSAIQRSQHDPLSSAYPLPSAPNSAAYSTTLEAVNNSAVQDPLVFNFMPETLAAKLPAPASPLWDAEAEAARGRALVAQRQRSFNLAQNSNNPYAMAPPPLSDVGTTVGSTVGGGGGSLMSHSNSASSTNLFVNLQPAAATNPPAWPMGYPSAASPLVAPARPPTAKRRSSTDLMSNPDSISRPPSREMPASAQRQQQLLLQQQQQQQSQSRRGSSFFTPIITDGISSPITAAGSPYKTAEELNLHIAANMPPNGIGHLSVEHYSPPQAEYPNGASPAAELQAIMEDLMAVTDIDLQAPKRSRSQSLTELGSQVVASSAVATSLWPAATPQETFARRRSFHNVYSGGSPPYNGGGGGGGSALPSLQEHWEEANEGGAMAGHGGHQSQRQQLQYKSPPNPSTTANSSAVHTPPSHDDSSSPTSSAGIFNNLLGGMATEPDVFGEDLLRNLVDADFLPDAFISE